ncbi:nuclear transport factor 2 family protein [Nocardioides marinus]|uniref:SnoaL-like domain-containing protein n=1 Tax=Nocardioides marinus TaxID=374514 RepID=A0A7Y9YDS4_9ACTN|nr:nuclear transport factor 2 family protein [Nocardioides marinus]NYI10365.1 hypothetical protein [Nocardioides marinus]
MDTMTGRPDLTDLPTTLQTFLTAHAARDVGAALATFTVDAVVTDQGDVYTGTDRVRHFLGSAGSEFTYTTQLLAARGSADRWVLTQRLEGDFPGGVADLEYAFTLRGALICHLSIG